MDIADDLVRAYTGQLPRMRRAIETWAVEQLHLDWEAYLEDLFGPHTSEDWLSEWHHSVDTYTILDREAREELDLASGLVSYLQLALRTPELPPVEVVDFRHPTPDLYIRIDLPPPSPLPTHTPTC